MCGLLPHVVSLGKNSTGSAARRLLRAVRVCASQSASHDRQRPGHGQCRHQYSIHNYSHQPDPERIQRQCDEYFPEPCADLYHWQSYAGFQCSRNGRIRYATRNIPADSIHAHSSSHRCRAIHQFRRCRDCGTSARE